MLHFTSLFLLTIAAAYQQDLAKLPNGNSYGLTLGHPGGATKRATALASTFYAAGQKWTKAFCMADADADGQSNGLEMGDPCCKWSMGQTPQFTTGLSDPNSAASKTLTPMPPCIMAKLMCAVCIQALQLDMAKPSKNAAEFSLTSVKSCKDATQDDAQKLLCVEMLLKNADQLVMDQMKGVAPIQSCMNLGLVCLAPTAAPTAPPTSQPTKAPTPPPPPRTNYKLSGVCTCANAHFIVGSCDSDECFNACDKKKFGHGVCTYDPIQIEASVQPSAQEPSVIILPLVISAIGFAVIVFMVKKTCDADETRVIPLSDHASEP